MARSSTRSNAGREPSYFSRYELLGVTSGSFCWVQRDKVSFDHYSGMLAKRYGLSLITANSNNYFVSCSLISDPGIPQLLRPENSLTTSVVLARLSVLISSSLVIGSAGNNVEAPSSCSDRRGRNRRALSFALSLKSWYQVTPGGAPRGHLYTPTSSWSQWTYNGALSCAWN